jgi:calcium-dependent protein kinase
MRDKWITEQLGVETKVAEQKRSSSLVHTSAQADEFTNYLAMKKLKKAALGYIATKLTQNEVGALETIFRSMDKNGDGYLSLIELDEAMAQGNFQGTLLNDLRELRHDLAVSAEEQIDWRDFVSMTMDHSVAVREDNVKRAFEHFKHTEGNYLTVSDLADIYDGEGQAKEVMEILDSDGDGKVSFEDFRRALVESMDEGQVSPQMSDDVNMEVEA